jgi:hypothetical protein
VKNSMLIVLGLIVIGISWSSGAGGDPCNGDAALDAALDAKGWQDLHQVSKRYPDCDDGAIAEAYSSFVVHTLATQWQTVNRLKALTDKDPRFLTFVLRHIDATALTDELNTTLTNATGRCPKGASGLCRSIAAAVRDTSTQ